MNSRRRSFDPDDVDRLFDAADKGVGHALGDQTEGAYAARDSAAVWQGVRVGAFRVIDFLDKGGMGSVFRARRVDGDFEQDVAVKLLRSGATDMAARFARERQILAQLTHPGIAKVIDGGVVSGRPYFVMELVDGEHIDAYCDRLRLSVDQRLALLLQVVRTVQYAHSRLVVHRDIKPSNILVTRTGEPKLLDFGIAKVLSQDVADLTLTALPLTPRFASPEQVLGEPVAVASDIYQLGLLMYGLLTGENPQNVTTPSVSEIKTAVVDRRAERPSIVARSLITEDPERAHKIARYRNVSARELARTLEGDLDLIVLKCLRKLPEERYSSAGELAADLQRFADGRPVRAHPPTWRYRFSKFARRHRTALALSTVAALAILASLGLAVQQAVSAREAAQLAQAESARATAVRNFMVDIFDSAKSHLPRDERPTIDELIPLAETRAREDRNLTPATRGALLNALGEVSLSVGDYERAEVLFSTANDLLREQLPPTHPDVLMSAVNIAGSYQWRGMNGEARDRLEPLLPMLRSHFGMPTIEGMLILGAAYAGLGEFDRAITLQRELLQTGRMEGAPPQRLLEAELSIGNMLTVAGRAEEAVTVFEAAIDQWRAESLPETQLLSAATENLAVAHHGLGNIDTSERLLRQVIAMNERIYDGPHRNVADAYSNLGGVLRNQGRFEEAAPLLREALRLRQDLLAPHNAYVVYSYVSLGSLELRRRSFDVANHLVDQALRACEIQLQEKIDACARAFHLRASLHFARGQWEGALADNQRAHELREQIFGEDHTTLVTSLAQRAMIETSMRRPDLALVTATAALEMADRTGTTRASQRADAHAARASAHFALGDHGAALKEISIARAQWQDLAPGYTARHVALSALQADALIALGRTEEAGEVARDALSWDIARSELDPAALDVLRRAANPD